jgi:hypothetical protein
MVSFTAICRGDMPAASAHRERGAAFIDRFGAIDQSEAICAISRERLRRQSADGCRIDAGRRGPPATGCKKRAASSASA